MPVESSPHQILCVCIFLIFKISLKKKYDFNAKTKLNLYFLSLFLCFISICSVESEVDAAATMMMFRTPPDRRLAERKFKALAIILSWQPPPPSKKRKEKEWERSSLHDGRARAAKQKKKKKKGKGKKKKREREKWLTCCFVFFVFFGG